MNTLSYTNFCELENEELYAVDGGGGLGSAVVTLLIVAGVVFVISLAGGCTYEIIFG